MTTYQSRNSANTYWEDLIFHISETPVPPTVTTNSLVMHFSLNCNITGSVVDVGSSPVLDAGFVWSSTNHTPTLADHVVDLHLTGDAPFDFGTAIGSLPFPATVYFSAYATNDAGTTYGNVLSGAVQICFAAGTLITTSKGKKKIEDISYEDELLVWNFDGSFLTYAKPVWMVQPFKANYYGLLKFSNGAELRTVADGRGHRIFNTENNMFTYSMNEDSPLGTTTITENCKPIQLVDKQIVRKDTIFYNILTHTHLNMYANEILTSSGLNNIYPIKNMKFVKDNRALAMNDFNVSDELFTGLRLAEQQGDIREKIARLVSRQRILS